MTHVGTDNLVFIYLFFLRGSYGSNVIFRIPSRPLHLVPGLLDDTGVKILICWKALRHFINFVFWWLFVSCFSFFERVSNACSLFRQ